jgi:Transposase DDE domain
VSWAQRRRVLAADLRSGSASDKPAAPGILLRALKTLPAGHGPVCARADSGFYSLEFLVTCRRKGVSFSVSMPRTTMTWEAGRHTGPRSWRPALQMRGRDRRGRLPAQCWKHETLRLIIRRPGSARPS